MVSMFGMVDQGADAEGSDFAGLNFFGRLGGLVQ